MPAIDAPPVTPAPRLAVPASLFAEEEPPFVLFDGRGRRADLAVHHRVHIAPSDIEALDRWLPRRLATLLASPQVAAEARAWALIRILRLAVAEALTGLPDRPIAATPLVEAVTAAATRIGDGPDIYLAALPEGPQTPGAHAVRTALLTLVLAAAAGVEDSSVLAGMTLAGALADAGRWRSPLPAVRRTGALTAGEWAVMRQHAGQSADLLVRTGVGTLATVQAVRHHHERWAGGGYPAGLTAASIPLGARVVAIADAYAALTSERLHAPARPWDEALREMTRSAGQFDPDLLRLFATVLVRHRPARVPRIARTEGMRPLAD